MEVSVELQKELIGVLAAFGQEKPFWESSFFIGLLPVAAVILSTYIGKWQAFQLQERQSEIEKQLRLHELQIVALKELSIIKYRVAPNIEPIQGADSNEWLSPVVCELNKVVNVLDAYLKSFAHISPSNVIEHIHKAIEIANLHKWGFYMSDGPGYDPSDEEIEGVKEMISELSSAIREFKCCVGIDVV